MRVDEAIAHLNALRPSMGHETNEAITAVVEAVSHMEIWNDCCICLRQGCQYREEKAIRINCPLFKNSAV